MQVEEMTTKSKTNRTHITTTTTTTTTSSNEFFSLDDEIGELLDNSAAKHKISVRPTRSKRSTAISENSRARQEKEATVRELIETEEEFVRDLKYLINNYIRWTDECTEDCKILAQHSQFLFAGIVDIHEFHKTVLLEGMKYYADQPNQIGRSFVRLERDFDKHAAYIDRMEGISEFLLDHPKINETFDNRSIELGDTGRTLIDYVRLPLQRLNDYSLLLSELIKISKQLGEPTHDLEKGLELVNWIPTKSRDIKFIQSIEGFGDTRAGRILRHDWFRLNAAGHDKERYCFLFKNKLLVTKVRRISPDRSVFILKEILQLPEYELIELENCVPEGELKEQGSFGLKNSQGNIFLFQSEPHIASGWTKDVGEFTRKVSSDESEPAVKKGRVIAEAAASVTINGVEITEVTTPNDENRSISIEEVTSNVNTHRVVDIPIQLECSVDSVSEESVRNEYNRTVDIFGTKVEELKESSAEILHQILIEEGETSDSVELLLSKGESRRQNVCSFEVEVSKRLTSQEERFDGEPQEKFESEATTAKKVSQEFSHQLSTQREEQLRIQKEEKEVETQRQADLLKHQAEEEAAEAEVLRQASLEKQRQEHEAEVKRQADLEQKAREEAAEIQRLAAEEQKRKEEEAAEIQRLAEEQRRKEAEIQRLAELEQKRKEEEQAAEAQRLADLEQKRKAEAEEQKRKEEAAEIKRLAAEEQKRKEEEAVEIQRLADLEQKRKEEEAAEIKRLADLEQKRKQEAAEEQKRQEEQAEAKRLADLEQKRKQEEEQAEEAQRQADLEKKKKEEEAQVQRQADLEKHRQEEKLKSKRDSVVKLPKEGSNKNLIRMDSNSTTDGDLKPGFTLNVKSVEVEPGENALLVVETSSNSPSIVTWLKENRPLSDKLADRVRIVSKDNVHTLTLQNCSDEDSGLYTAKCSNQYGTSCSSGFINVHEFTPEERQQKSLERQPNFLIKMKDTELLRDTTICFIVKPTGDPEPTLKFYKDDKEVVEDDRVYIGKTGDLVELTIRNVTDDDAGTYSVIGKNRYGENTTSAILTITDEKSVFPGLSSQLLEPGEEPEFSWYRDGVKFAPEDKFKVLFKDDEDSLALVFQHVRPEDAGLYTCVASTSSGRISCSAELTVQGAIHQLLREPEAPEITAELTDTEVSTGGSAMLELKVTGFPKPDVSWYKDGVEIQAGGKYRFLYEDDESIALIIKGVDVNDAGQYLVVARNDLGEASTSGKLLVNCPPKFKTKMQDSSCMTDEPFTMSVTVQGSPEPVVKWYKDGQLLIESERIQMTKTGDGVFTITFEHIKMDDTGAYSVVASNSIGQMSEFWNLVAHSKAKFTKTIDSVIEIEENETKVLKVEVSGNPAPEVRYFLGEKQVATGLEYKYKCTNRDDKRISVTCSNAFGADECSAEVKVLRSSKIKTALKNATVKYNEDATFSVKVDEFPKGKVSWFIDGIEIDGKKYEKVDEGDTHTLKIHGVTESATIKVKAENKYGFDEQEARLDVIRKPTITRHLKESYTELEQKSLKLSVDVTANPEPVVQWFHNGQEVDADARIKIHREGTETWNLTFNVLLPSDSGDWTVKMKNEAGEAESKTVIIVEGKPEFEKKLVETVECVESESVAFEVKVQGSPAPVIQWSLNSEELTVTTRTSIETNSQRSTTISKLVINNTLLEDSGKVTCVARNEHGSCETSTQLIVQKSGPKLNIDASPRVVELGKPLKLNATVSDGATIKWLCNGKEIGKGNNLSFTPEKDCIVQCVATDANGEASVDIPVRVMSLPKITGLKDVTCGPGDSVTLTAKIESELDGLQVTWHKGEEKVKECTDGDYTLKLDNIKQTDGGKYTVTAQNQVGSTTLSAKLNVLVEEPSFARGLSDVRLREGEALTLRVRVNGLPEPTVKWCKDGKPIVVEGKDGIYDLSTEASKLEDFGSYTVTAENIAGSASTAGKVILIEEKPMVTKGPERSKTVDETEPFTLSAAVSGSPIPTVQWFKDGEPLKLEPGRVEISSGAGGIQKLVVAKAEKGDEGTYTLEVKNPLSTVKSSPSQVSVVPLPIPPTVKLAAPEEATHGSEISLAVTITGEPVPKLILTGENDKPVEPIRTVKDDAKPGTINYILKAPGKGTSVTYAAQVVSPLGKGNDELLVKLNAPPSAPLVIESLPPQKSAVDGTALKLISVISGSPLPKVQWLRDNVPIPCETSVVDGKLHTSVLVDSVGDADSGLYTLVAENPVATEKQQCQVSVLGKVDDSKPLEAPDFSTSLPENIIVNEGDELLLVVGVSGNPLPEVQWGRIKDSGVNGVVDDDGAKQPAVTPVDKDGGAQKADLGLGDGDDGKDKAGLGDGAAPAGDEGEGAGAADKPTGLEGPEKVDGGQADIGDGSKAEVKPAADNKDKAVVDDSKPAGKKSKAGSDAVSAPSSVKTANAGPTLEPLSSAFGPEAKVDASFDGKNAILRVPGMRHGYEGPVSVTLTNPLGSKTGTVNVGVRKVYTPARITDRFNDVHQVRGGDAKFSAKVSGDPRPDVEWYFGNKLLPQDTSKYGFRWDGKTASLTVRNVGDSDLGSYKLRVKNLEGSDECSGILRELSSGQLPPSSALERGEKPYFLKKIANTEYYEGMSVKFTACVGGIPEPEFHWFKDDIRIYPSGRCSLENNGNGLLRLVLNKADIQDLGVYKLKIFNQHGEDQCQATCSTDDFHVSSSGADTKSSLPRVAGPPNPLPDKPIISSMTDRHLTLSWKPALRTHVDYPVTYIVEMCPANTNDWFKLRSGIKGCVTEVRNLEPGQDYKFRVRVENRVGVSEPSPYAQALRSKFDWRPTPWTPPGGDYDLNRPPHPGFTHAPKFLNKNTEQYGVSNAGIGVEWWCYGYPKPTVTFFFNGEQLSSTDHVFDSNGRVVLYIDKLSESREGWYECVANNEHGEDRYRIHVLIGEHPRWIIRLQETHVLERKDGKLSGVVTGKPAPDLKWYKDWTTLGESSRIKFTVLETEPWTYRVTCTLTDSILKDHGLYSCAASNVVGTSSSSANIAIEEFEEEWRYRSYNKRLSPISLKNKSPYEFYHFGDEVGRGTQGITRHATGIQNGVSVAIKSMESNDAMKREWMREEFSIHSDLFHPGITRVSDGYQDEKGVHIVTDICTGGDIIGNCISRGGYSEHQISDYIRQLLLSLDYLHNNRSVAHLGINAFDLLFSHEESDTIKLTDFGLARRITSKLERLDYGHPEFASPEILNGEGAGYHSDMWSVGIITYLLLNGTTPFIGSNDVETMDNVKRGTWDLLNKHISDDAQDFIRRLLAFDYKGRLDVRRALEHPWISRYYSNSTKKITSSFQSYRTSLQKWYDNASCRTIYRRNPWSYAYSHQSRMIYPPGEVDYEASLGSRDPRAYNFGVPTYPRPDLNIDVGIVKSESHYQNGPDTYLLQLRDSGFPARLRQYMKVAASRSPSFALQLKSQAYDRNNPIIRERRRFTDVMDEEVKDELTQGKEWRGEPRRLRHEVGLHLDTSAQADAMVALHKDGTPGFIREGPAPVIKANIGDSIVIPCIVAGSPHPTVQWFKNDLVMGQSHRVIPEENQLKINNFNETDFGLYKLTARNTAGSDTIKFRIVQGHYATPQESSIDYNSIESNIIRSENTSVSFNELITDGNFGRWSIGATDGQNLAQRLSNPVENLELKSSLAHLGLFRVKSLINDSSNLYFAYHESASEGFTKLVDKFILDGVYTELDITNAVQQMLSALSYIQWRGLQLLNISLDNILINSRGIVKLFDTSSLVRVTKIGSALPIPSVITQYTAPELLSGDPVHMTTDIWAIGCVVYSLLSGCWAFAGEDDKQTRGNIQFVRYRFEPLYVESSPEATRFVMMIFKKCPMKRPTLEEVLESRWLGSQESLVRKRNNTSFKSVGLEKLVSSSSFIIS